MIFVVDDDARIRAATAGALRDQGYEVADFENGAEALLALKRSESVRLIVSDVQMPDMNGPEFVSAALKLRPDVQIHYISGDIGLIPFEALAPWPLLAKPFTAAKLVQAVAELLV